MASIGMFVMTLSALPHTSVILQTITPSIYPRHDYLGFPDGLHPDEKGNATGVKPFPPERMPRGGSRWRRRRRTA